MPRKRINVVNLSPGQLQSYRDALARLRCDGQVYRTLFADFHTAMHAKGIHGGELFLPWHRGFLLRFETELEKRGCAIGVPYWDFLGWDVRPATIPAAFTARAASPGACAGVNGNPLFMDRHPHNPGGCDGCQPIPSPAGWQAILGQLRTFEEFGGGLGKRPGTLEKIHNQVHHRSGRYMVSVPTSVADPLFWSVHSNVDRLWREAQSRNSNFSPPDSLRRRSLPGLLKAPGVELTVQDVETVSPQRAEYVDRSMAARVRTDLDHEPRGEIRVAPLPDLARTAFRALRFTLRGVPVESDVMELNLRAGLEGVVISFPFFASPVVAGHRHGATDLSVLVTRHELAGGRLQALSRRPLTIDAARLEDRQSPLVVAPDAELTVDVLTE